MTPEGPLDGRGPAWHPLVSVVLLNFNGQRFASLWESFFRDPYAPKEIVFVDNGSSDESAEAFRTLARRHPEVPARVLALPVNVGYSQGNNAGVREAHGELLALVNNDIEVAPTWIAPAVQAFGEEPRLGVAQSALFDLYHRDRPDRVWNRVDAWGFAHPAADLAGARPEVFYAEGAAMFVRRRLVDDLGYLYPPEFYLLGEDMDLCWRARLRGWRVVVLTASKAWHARGGTEAGSVTKRNPRVLQAVTRNRLASLYANYGRPRQLLFVPLSGLLALGRALLLAARGDRPHARAVLRGLAQFVHDLPSLRARRGRVQGGRTVPEREVVRWMMDPGEGLRSLRDLWEETRPGAAGPGAPV